MSPLEWDKLDRQTQCELIAKRNLDVEFDAYLKEQAQSDNN